MCNVQCAMCNVQCAMVINIIRYLEINSLKTIKIKIQKSNC